MYDDDVDICYECQAYGDDYYFDEDGNLISACETCWVKEMDEDEQF